MVQTRRSNKSLRSSRKKNRRRQTNRQQTYRKRNRRQQKGGNKFRGRGGAEEVTMLKKLKDLLDQIKKEQKKGKLFDQKNHNTLIEVENDLIDENINDDDAQSAVDKALNDAAGNGGDEGVNMVEVLLNAGADVETCISSIFPDGKHKNTPLISAAHYGGVTAARMMRLLLDAGADANAQDWKGWTALMEVANLGPDRWGEHDEDGIPKMMEMLLNAGAEVNAKNKDGKTALKIAIENDKVLASTSTKMTLMLLDAGANEA